MRMDRYSTDEDELIDEEVNLSRIHKNQEIYDDIYLNASLVDDITNVFEDEEQVEEKKEELGDDEEIKYEKKNYSINDYLEKAHEKINPDNDVRSLSDSKFIEQEDEISKLISSIEEKSDDFFSELIGDNEDTMIEGQLTQEEVEITYEEFLKTSLDDEQLDKALGNETIHELQLEEEGINDTFQDILKTEKISKKRKHKISLIVFFITLFILVCLVVLLIIFK